jgi:hypothetical protein
MSYLLTKMLIKDSIKKNQKEKLKKTFKNIKIKNWTTPKKDRLHIKKSWVFK